MNKKEADRIRRGRRFKARHKRVPNNRPRLVVYRSNCNIYCQIVVHDTKGDKVLVSSSTLDKELGTKLTGTKVEQAFQVGKLLGERAKAKEVTEVSFDRAGYKYHGRIKALADGAREAGLNF